MQYLKLSVLANDLITSLCSEEKLRNMLLEVTQIRNALSWQKVASWSKAVVASLKKLKVDYSSFQDVVAPFSTGLTMVTMNRFPVYLYYIMCRYFVDFRRSQHSGIGQPVPSR